MQNRSVSLEAALRDHQTDAGGYFTAERVISTVLPVEVRQDAPGGPHYQEALGYRFLLCSPKYPGLCRMEDGTLVLTLSVVLRAEAMLAGKDEGRTEVMLYSHDGGATWSQPHEIPGYRTTTWSGSRTQPLMMATDSVISTTTPTNHQQRSYTTSSTT